MMSYTRMDTDLCTSVAMLTLRSLSEVLGNGSRRGNGISQSLGLHGSKMISSLASFRSMAASLWQQFMAMDMELSWKQVHQSLE